VLLQELGGWAHLVMVQRYAHHRPERAVAVTDARLAARERALGEPESHATPHRQVRVGRGTP